MYTNYTTARLFTPGTVDRQPGIPKIDRMASHELPEEALRKAPQISMNEFLYKDQTYRILGACFEVYNQIGCGFLEPVYQECLEIELSIEQIPFGAKAPVTLSYKQRRLNKTYEPDFVCFDNIILEIKAVSSLVDGHRAQLLNYMCAAGTKVGLLVNFGNYPKLQYQRLLYTKDHL